MATDALTHPKGIHHVRLTVTDIARSKAFYTHLFGADPAVDNSDKVDQPGVKEDPKELYGGAVFEVGDQILGLRPVATTGDTFDSTRVGLDHISLSVGTRDELQATSDRLTAAGVEHGEIIELEDMGLAILSVQDPDDINLELNAPL